jgi:hypothetical protein
MVPSFVSRTILAVSLVFLATGTIAMPAQSTIPAWAVHGPYANTALFRALRSHSGTKYRVTVNLTEDTNSCPGPMYQEMAGLATTDGITLKPILSSSFTWGDRTDDRKYPARGSTALYLQGSRWRRVVFS